jgi:hypothetical protein
MNVIPGNVSSSLNETFTRYSYNLWFNGTNEEYGLPTSKLEESSFAVHGVDAISLALTQVYINSILVYIGYDEVFNAEGNADYSFRNDGYGLGMSSYVDALNNILINNNLLTRFFPAANNGLVGNINSKENFEIRFEEEASGPDIVTDYRIRVESYSNDPSYSTGPGMVFDTVNVSVIPWS